MCLPEAKNPLGRSVFASSNCANSKCSLSIHWLKGCFWIKGREQRLIVSQGAREDLVEKRACDLGLER